MHAAGRRAALAGIAIGALLAGCGFQPRGQAMPGEAAGNLYIDAPPALEVEIESALAGSALRRSASRAGADAVLVVRSERFERRVLSVGPYDGSEREAEIAYTVDFRTGHGGEGSALEVHHITLRRDYLSTPEEVVAKEHEEDLIRAELRREGAALLLRRAAAALVSAASQ